MPAKRTTRTATRGKDAINLLKADHKTVRALLKKLEKTETRDSWRNQFEQIDSELKIHTRIEEEIFYPAFRDAARAKEQKKLYFEAKEEHHVVDFVLSEMRTSGL